MTMLRVRPPLGAPAGTPIGLGQSQWQPLPGVQSPFTTPPPQFSPLPGVQAPAPPQAPPPPAGAPALRPSDGPTRITLSAFEPGELKGAPGARVEVWLAPNPAWGGAPGAAPSPAGSGSTDLEGRFVFTGQAPSPNEAWMWRLVVAPPGRGASLGQAAPPGGRVVDVPARTQAAMSAGNNAAADVSASVLLCPPGTDPLVCEVAEKQLQFTRVFTQQLQAWNYESSGRPPQIASFAADMAHAAIETTSDPTLAPDWAGNLSWFATDLGIPPKDWPELVARYRQARRVFDEIPFPEIGGGDVFERCARGIPLWKGMSAANPRLYSATWSDYFPRRDDQIRADMAAQYTINIRAIFGCIEHKLRRKAAEIERSRRAWAVAGLVTTFMLAPVAGGASASLIPTEVAEFALSNLTGGGAGEYQDVVTRGVSAASDIAAGDLASIGSVVAAGLTLLLSRYAEDLDPLVANVAGGAVGQAAGAAAEDLLAGSGPAAGALDFLSLQAVGSAAAAVAVRLVVNVIKAQGVRSLEEFRDVVMGLADIHETMVPFKLWAINALLLNALFEAAARQAADESAREGDPRPGLESPDAGAAITWPLADRARRAGVDVPGSVLAPGVPVGAGGGAGPALAVAGGGALLALLFAGGILR